MDAVNFNWIWTVFLLPLAGSLLQALGGKIITDALGPKLGRQVAGWLGVAPIALAFLIALPIFLALTNMPPDQRFAIVTLFDWIDLQTIRIPFEFRVDPLSMTMVLIITGIGSLIHMYAVGYMAEEKDFTRFFTYLNLFIALMLVLVLGNNLALLFIGWEGVGLCSYLLIGFWYKDLANSKAANKAFIVNRVGDVGLTLGMFFIVVTAALNREAMALSDNRWLSYDVLLPKLATFLQGQPALATTIALLLFVGAMGKSAQFPLYVWLPDAMAGPTPVSALIHAATMVTSGVVLLNRMQEVFVTSPVAMGVVALIGAATALIGALIAFGQTDIKKVLAYSTVSQLGYMFIACGVGAFYAGMFHVITHAFFKALLFLGSGAVIHAMAHNQDMRNYGRLIKYIPITAWTMIIGWAAIAGLPFVFSGFWSKEAILGSALGVSPMIVWGLPVNVIAGWTGLIVAGMTAWYMTRMMVLTFGTGEERWRLIPAHDHGNGHGHAHDHHDHQAHAHHGPDEHGLFLSDDEVAQREALDHEHHHDLDSHHEPKEVPWTMWFPLAVLAVFSFGWIGWLLYKKDVLGYWLAPLGSHPHLEHAGGLGYYTIMGLSIAMAVAGIGIGYTLYKAKLPDKEGFDEKKWNPFFRASNRQFGFDFVITDGSVKLGNLFGAVVRKFDEWVVDGIVNGVGYVSYLLGSISSRFQTGFVRSYALFMQVGVVILLAAMVWFATLASRGM